MIDSSYVDILIKDFGFYPIITIIIIIATIVTFPKFIESSTYFKSRKIKYITEALNSEWVDSDSKKILGENISRIYLSSALNIRADRKKIKEIVKIYERLEGSADTIEIYKAFEILPDYFYDFPLDIIKIKNKNIYIVCNIFKVLITICITIAIYLFVFSISEIITSYNEGGVVNAFLKIDFKFVIAIFLSLTANYYYICMKEYYYAHKVLGKYMRILS